jgi:23S rRNA pseudouridine2605 synthase
MSLAKPIKYKLRSSAGVSLARALSKLGYCSRTQAAALIQAGQVKVNTQLCTNPLQRVDLKHDVLEITGQTLAPKERIYFMLNKPRGLLTTRADEHHRATIYNCLQGMDLPHLVPVGRLDKASEGLLLLTNDTQWAAHLTDPQQHVDKTYHVQIDQPPTPACCAAITAGIWIDEILLKVKTATILRSGSRHGWLEITLDEGKNRHIRRLLGALDLHVLRLVRVSIGPLQLGDLPKGAFRSLTALEIQALNQKHHE